MLPSVALGQCFSHNRHSQAPLAAASAHPHLSAANHYCKLQQMVVDLVGREAVGQCRLPGDLPCFPLLLLLLITAMGWIKPLQAGSHIFAGWIHLQSLSPESCDGNHSVFPGISLTEKQDPHPPRWLPSLGVSDEMPLIKISAKTIYSFSPWRKLPLAR